MSYLFTSESVRRGHPDKVADQISDAILDECLRQDPNSHVACETMVTTGLTMICGEITTEAYVDIEKTARSIIEWIGYNNNSNCQFDARSCGIMTSIHQQSPDINKGVSKGEGVIGAGDQGMMFGHATNETVVYMPLPIYVARTISQVVDDMMYDMSLPHILPDGKCQVTVEYDDKTNKPIRIDTILVSLQHDSSIGTEKVYNIVKNKVIPNVIYRLDCDDGGNDYYKNLFKGYKLIVNPTGQFIIGGPAGDTGLTGRKIIVDTYGGACPHGGGAFSGKDGTKVDRSGAYAARYVAKNIVAAGIADKCTVQIAYAIGVAEPVSIFIDTHGTMKAVHNNNDTLYTDTEIAKIVSDNFDLTPKGIIDKFELTKPKFEWTAEYGPFGYNIRENNHPDFLWEKLDMVDKLKFEINKF